MIRKFLVTAALLALAPSAFAATCSVDIEGNDAMKYDVANIDISKSCKTFTINLKHTGKLAKNIMGHNVVIAKTADRSEEHTSELQSLMRSSYAVFCLHKKHLIHTQKK